jgi:putative glutamine amidotransferase
MSKRRQAPLIGITCEVLVREKDFSDYDLLCDHRYAQAVKNAGGHPVLLPIAHRKSVLNRYLEGVDGLVIVGGDDVDPGLYGEAARKKTRTVFPHRITFESWLYQSGKRRGLPILAICYGMQLVNVLEGGTLYQHIYPKRRGPRIPHGRKKPLKHKVKILPGTRLRKILGVWQARVSSQHHQAVRQLAPGFTVSAVSEDGIIEAIEHPDRPELLAVQWHPEHLFKSRITNKLFEAFLRNCRKYRGTEA